MLNRLAEMVRTRLNNVGRVRPAAQSDLDLLRDFALGERVRAQVMALLPGGRAQVKIDNRLITLPLPFRARTGENLDLTVSESKPNLRFEVCTPTENEAAATTLSDTARFISRLLETDRLPLAMAPPSSSALLAGPPVETAQVAFELQRALAQSGIFYESHQAQWAAGERDLSLLMSEPQASLPPLPATDAARIGYSAEEITPDSEPRSGTGRRALDGMVHPEALTIVRQQLDTLATQHVVWNGIIWDGQPLRWEIADRSAAPGNTAERRGWYTRLQLTLPRLGEVSAMLHLAARAVSISLQVATPAAATVLTAGAAGLVRLLRDAGLAPVSVTVNDNEAR